MLDKYRKRLVQFVHLALKLDLRASKDYSRNKIDLPRKSMGAVATFI